VEENHPANRQKIKYREMPNYRVHDAINLTALGMTFAGHSMLAGSGVITDPSGGAMIGYTLSYLTGTFLVTLDLDLHGSKPKKRWGLLRALWRPYATLMPHRKLSHGWLIGPLTRLAYLLLLSLPLLTITNTLEITRYLIQTNLKWDALIAITLGYYASQWMHLIADRAPLRP